MNKLRVELGELGYNSKVWLDGEEITTSLTGLAIDADAVGLTTVQLRMVAQVEGTVTAEIPGFDGIERLRRRFNDVG